VPIEGRPTAEADQGYMTSVCYSPTLGHAIGLGLIARGHLRIGERVRAVDPVRNGDVVVEITEPVFYDRDGGRQRG
jgi:sarcosine oxidase subunit alpha